MTRRLCIPLLVLAFGFSLAACGSQGIDVAEDDPNRAGAEIFYTKCAGCHTLSKVGAEGSASKITDVERVDGPNFDQRKETVAGVLTAIRNGGFSGAIMPENIVTGPEAQAVAEFLAKYSGAKSPGAAGPNG